MSRLTVNFVSSPQCDNVRVFRQDLSTPDSPWLQVATLPPGSRFYHDDNVEFGGRYKYKIGIVFNDTNRIYYSNEMEYQLGENITVVHSSGGVATFMYDGNRMTQHPLEGTATEVDVDINGITYIGGSTGSLAAMDTEGEIIWRSFSPENTATIDLIATVSGFIYYACGATVYKLNTETGDVVWALDLSKVESDFTLTSNITGIAVTVDDEVYAVANSRVWFINNDGSLYWIHRSISGVIQGVETDLGKNAYILNGTNSVRKITPANMQEWNRTGLGGQPKRIRRHYAFPNRLYIQHTTNNIEVVDSETQETIQTITSLGATTDFQVLRDGSMVLIGAGALALRLINPLGQEVWRRQNLIGIQCLTVTVNKQSNLHGLYQPI